MAVTDKKRFLLRYGTALGFSLLGLSLCAALHVDLGFMPLLLVPAIALVETFAGPGPAILSVVLCTLVSIRFLQVPAGLNEELHDIAKLALFPPAAASVVYLMESHRRQRRVATQQTLELSVLLESMPEAVFIINPGGRIVNVNAAGEQLCNRTRGELAAMRYEEIAKLLSARGDDGKLEPSQLALIRSEGGLLEPSQFALIRALRGETVQAERRLFISPKDGSLIEAVVSASPMRTAKGRLIGAVLIVRDTTETMHLQRRVADTERHLAIGQMASGMAHDFNNVLNTITQASALLQLRPDMPREESLAYLRMIDTAARNGAEIIRHVREYIRGGTGEMIPVDLREVLREALRMTQPIWGSKAGLQIETDLQPAERVMANPPDLRRVFTNLIMNALQAMPDGGKLTLQCKEHEGIVSVWIRDTGEGIPPEVQNKIFSPYFTTKKTGTGLGLSTAQKTLLAMGGNIMFISEQGKGTSFRVELPTAERKQTSAA